MNIANNIGTAQHQDFAAIFLAPVIVQGGVALLDVCPHCAVIDDDAFSDELEKVGQLVLSSRFSVLSPILSNAYSLRTENRELRTVSNTTTPGPLGTGVW